MAADGATAEVLRQTSAVPLTLSYRVSPELLNEAMHAIGKATMKRQDPEAKPRTGLRAVMIWGLLLVCISAVIDLMKASGARFEPVWIALGVAIGLWIYQVYLVNGYKRMARQMAANPVFEGEIETRLGADGIEIRSQGAVQRIDWEALDDVLDLKEGVVLMVPATLAPIPDNALPTRLSRNDLKRQIEAWKGLAAVRP